MKEDLVKLEDAMKAVNLVIFKHPYKSQIDAIDTWQDCYNALKDLPIMKGKFK